MTGSSGRTRKSSSSFNQVGIRDNGWGRRRSAPGPNGHSPGSEPGQLPEPMPSPEPTLSPQSALPSRSETGLASHEPSMIPDEEMKLDYLLRKADERLVSSGAPLHHGWKHLHSDLLHELVTELQNVGPGAIRGLRAMHTSVACLIILIGCYVNGKMDKPEDLTSVKCGVQDIVLGYCTVPCYEAREEAYQALTTLSSSDHSLVKRNCSELVQLLLIHGPRDHDIINEMLAKHMDLALSDCLQVMVDEYCAGPPKSLILDFLTSDQGRDALATVIGDPVQEIKLAQMLAPVLPLAGPSHIGKVIDILSSLQDIWLDPEGPPTDQQLARDMQSAEAALLWHLCLALMVQGGTYKYPTKPNTVLESVRIETIVNLAFAPPTFIKGGLAHFERLVQTALDGSTSKVLSRAQTKPSASKVFIEELEDSIRYFFCVLPAQSNAQAAEECLQYFSPAQQVAFFRSTANLAARILAAERLCPVELGFSAESHAQEMLGVISRALMAHVPVQEVDVGGTIGVPTLKEAEQKARDACLVLAAEALLAAAHHCELTLTLSSCAAASFSRDVKAHLRALMDLAGDARRLPEEVHASAAMLLRLCEEYTTSRRPRQTGDHIALKPEWLMPPPPFPESNLAASTPAWKPIGSKGRSSTDAGHKARKGEGSPVGLATTRQVRGRESPAEGHRSRR